MKKDTKKKLGAEELEKRAAPFSLTPVDQAGEGDPSTSSSNAGEAQGDETGTRDPRERMDRGETHKGMDRGPARIINK